MFIDVVVVVGFMYLLMIIIVDYRIVSYRRKIVGIFIQRREKISMTKKEE